MPIADLPEPSAENEPRSVRVLVVGVVLAVVAGAVGVSAAVRFSPFDDEANSIANASASLSEIIEAGLGKHRQFHPPLWEILLHGWLRVVSAASLPLLRAPAIVLWLAALVAIPWALTPIATRRERWAAAALTMLWPAHLVLPFAASWYALAGFLSVILFGGLLRVLLADERAVRSRGAVIAVAATVVLGYTVFAWPIVLGAASIGAAAIAGVDKVRARLRSLGVLAVLLLLPLVPTIVAVGSRLGPMVAHKAGGGLLLSVAACAALLAGHSAPASLPLLALAGLAVVATLGLTAVFGDRRARGCLLAGSLVLSALALTNTLNDKRLLLGSIFFPLALGLTAEKRVARWMLPVFLLATVPAWMGWSGLTTRPWLFPRWQDPIAEIAALHVTGSPPRVLVSDEPAVAYAVAAHDGVRPGWSPISDLPDASRSLLWRLRSPAVLLSLLHGSEAGGPDRASTVDIIVSGTVENWERSTANAFELAGWRRAIDRQFGADPFAHWRHDVSSSYRMSFMRFERP